MMGGQAGSLLRFGAVSGNEVQTFHSVHRNVVKDNPLSMFGPNQPWQ